MMLPLTRWQKVVAYAALALVGLWTLWGFFAIWVMLTEGRS
jgi:hypothetical protein